jgi:hypothetical protein
MPGNINFTGNLNELTSLRLVQLNRYLDFTNLNPSAGAVGRQFLLCSPQYPVIGVAGWMTEYDRAYTLFTGNNFDMTTNQTLMTDGNTDGKPRYASRNDAQAYIVVYPGYGFKGWTSYYELNEGDAHGNTPITCENRTDDIQWWYLKNGQCSVQDGISGGINNVNRYGLNLNQNSPPNLNPGGNYTYDWRISSCRVYKL